MSWTPRRSTPPTLPLRSSRPWTCRLRLRRSLLRLRMEPAEDVAADAADAATSGKPADAASDAVLDVDADAASDVEAASGDATDEGTTL